MTTKLAKLSNISLREAWEHEALHFTPWLFDNMDLLSEALGLELEATGKEVDVAGFSADIVAEDSETGSRVLIENQLEGSDHSHLGQILTYIAGVEADAMVWIARDFHSAHLSAIRWLNENTKDDFAFFAVRVRVVRIADSPLAPVFEVVEKPDSWGRKLGKAMNAQVSELTELRERFWLRYAEAHPGVIEPAQTPNVWVAMLPDHSIYLSMFVGSRASGMFLRGPRGTDRKALADFMAEHAEKLDKELGPSQSITDGYYYGIETNIRIQEIERWDELICWMEKHRQRYAAEIQAVAAVR